MGGDPSPNPNTTQTVTTINQLPAWYQDYLQQLIPKAQDVAETPYQAYGGQRVAGLTPEQNTVYDQLGKMYGGLTPQFDKSLQMIGDAGNGNTLGAIGSYTDAAKDAGQDQFSNASSLFNNSANTNTANTSLPYLNSGVGLAGQAASGDSIGAASQYLNAASSSFPQSAQAYMNPYNDAVTSQIAKLGARNLSENLLPSINDKFIQAGTFGSSNNRDLVGRALRDTQESVLGQQAGVLQQGYGQAGQLFGADASRQAGLAGTVGGLSSADLSRMLSSGQTIGQLGLGQAGANATDASRQIQAGQGLSNIGQANQQQTLGLANLASNATQADYARMLQSGLGLASSAQTANNVGMQQSAALEAAGQARQQNQQTSLDTAYQDFLNQRNYPQQQVDFLSSIIHGLPVNTSSYRSQTGPGSTSQMQPSVGGQIGGLGAGLAGLFKAGVFKAKGGAVRTRNPRNSFRGNTLGSLKAA